MSIRCVKCGDVWDFDDYYCDRCESHAVEETNEKPTITYKFFMDKEMTKECAPDDPGVVIAARFWIRSGKRVDQD